MATKDQPENDDTLSHLTAAKNRLFLSSKRKATDNRINVLHGKFFEYTF